LDTLNFSQTNEVSVFQGLLLVLVLGNPDGSREMHLIRKVLLGPGDKTANQKAAEFSGVAGEFRCHSLHRSQISKDL